MKIPSLSPRYGEIALLGILGVGVLVILLTATLRGEISGLDVAAFLLVLQRIVEAVQKSWEQRSLDRMGASLANAPASTPPAGEP